MIRSAVLALLAASPLAGTLFAADLITVSAAGGGDFSDLQAAIDFAADGDTLVVWSGSYASARIVNKGLHIVERTGNDVTISQGLVVRDTLTQHEVVLIGLTIQGDHAGALGQAHAVHLDVARGPVRLEECTLVGAEGGQWTGPDDFGGDGLLIELGLDVALVRCAVTGGEGGFSFGGNQFNRGGDGVRAEAALLAIHDCDLLAGDAGDHDLDGDSIEGFSAHGLRLFNSTAVMNGSSATGGRGGETGILCPQGGHGVWVADAASHFQFLDCALEGGPPGCSAGQFGFDLESNMGGTVDQLSGTARRHVSPSPALEGAQLQFDFHGEPGDGAWLLLSWNAGQLHNPALNGALLVGAPLLGQRRFMGVVPGSGTLTKMLTAPLLAPGEEAGVLYLQSMFTDTGTGVWLSSPSSLVLID